MAVTHVYSQFPSLASTHNGRPARVLTMVVPLGYPHGPSLAYSQWPTLTDIYNGRP
jgi:hypothetical protein